MFDRFKARMTGPGAGDSAPPTRRKGGLNPLTAIAVLLCVAFSASTVLAGPLVTTVQFKDVTAATSSIPAVVGPVAVFGSSNFNVTALIVPTEGATTSNVQTTTVTIRNTGSGVATLEILVSVQNYALPSGTPLVFSSSASGNATISQAGDTALFQSYADASNNTFLAGFGGMTTPGSQSGVPNPPILAGATNYSFGAQTTIGTMFPRISGNDFSLSQRLIITLNAGDNATLSLTSAVAAPLPSTAGLGLVLMGGLGGVGGIRRLNSRRALA